MEMDSDFSHDPRDLPRLIAAADDADLVLGSRYVDWRARRGLGARPAARRVAAGRWYARTILRVPVRDLTGGFKCFRRDVLEAIDLDDVHADGYGFQIEMTYRALKAGFRVREVPIVFRDRRAGSVEDDRPDRRRGGLEGAGAQGAAALASGAGVSLRGSGCDRWTTGSSTVRGA